MEEQAREKKIPAWVQKVLQQYTQQLIENYYALPLHEHATHDHEEYHVLIRTASLQQLIENFIMDFDLQTCCESIAQFYVQRYEQQFALPHEVSMLQKMKNLASVYHLWEQKQHLAYLEHAIFDYIPGDKVGRAALQTALATLFRLLLQKWQAMVRHHQQFTRILPDTLQKNDIGMSYDGSFIGLMSALMNQKNSQRLASIVSADGAHFDQYDNMHSKQILDAVYSLQSNRDMLWCLLYIFHYQMKHDLIEMTTRYNTALHARPSYV